MFAAYGTTVNESPVVQSYVVYNEIVEAKDICGRPRCVFGLSHALNSQALKNEEAAKKSH